jgi:hypothetical protein
MSSIVKKLIGKIIGPKKKSTFFSNGQITPEEYVLAGDQLVTRCPSWVWGTCDNKRLLVSYLPPDKQFLVTKGRIPCKLVVFLLVTFFLDIVLV